jgi:ATPase subunit of ABC transporter with duplicated ATPase domains
MSLLTVEQLSYTFADRKILKRVEMQLTKHHHAALVGPNGTGKSTLLSLLGGHRLPDEGRILWLPGTKIGYLTQQLDIDPEASLRAVLLTAFADLYALEHEMLELADKIAVTAAEEPTSGSGQSWNAYTRRFAETQELLLSSGFYDIDTTVAKVADGLGLTALGLETPVSMLSGGQRTKVALAKLLLQQPDVLLLDEPTNYLDTMHVDWLAGYLSEYPHAFIVVSHDTAFLNRIANVVFHLLNQELTRYPGNYDAFLKAFELRKNQAQTLYQQQQEEIRKLETYIQKNKVRASTATQAKSREKRLAKTLAERIDPPKSAPHPRFRFHYLESPTAVVAATKDLIIGYGNPLFGSLDLKVKRGAKVAVTGFNGIGKTTLLRTLLGEVPSLSGSVVLGDGVRVGYFEQEARKVGEETPLESIWMAYPKLTHKEVRQALAACGMRGEKVLQPSTTLSGGEQAKVRLCHLMLSGANWLVLDEPTNHLDAEAKGALREALMTFDGTIVLVTHESEFYRDWITDIWDVSRWRR